MAAPDRLYFTEDDEANRLLAVDPFALLVGFALDQQITVQHAFAGPLRIKQRVGTLDPKTLAHTDHRFPGSMAKRVQELAAYIADEYDGDSARIWNDAADSDDLRSRLAALPGFGDMKVRSMLAVLAKRFGVAKAIAPSHPTLGDVDSPQALADYQAAKRAYKAAQKAAR
jgi:uncharacterized HhH-GPD family protein